MTYVGAVLSLKAQAHSLLRMLHSSLEISLQSKDGGSCQLYKLQRLLSRPSALHAVWTAQGQEPHQGVVIVKIGVSEVLLRAAQQMCLQMWPWQQVKSSLSIAHACPDDNAVTITHTTISDQMVIACCSRERTGHRSFQIHQPMSQSSSDLI